MRNFLEYMNYIDDDNDIEIPIMEAMDSPFFDVINGAAARIKNSDMITDFMKSVEKKVKSHKDIFKGSNYITISDTVIKVRSPGGKIATFALGKGKFADHIRKFDILDFIKNNKATKSVMGLAVAIYTYLKDKARLKLAIGVNGFFTKKESAALADLNKKFAAAVQKEDDAITVFVGKKSYPGIIGAINVSGVPRADMALINTDHVPVVFISHKDGKSSSDFQQYSGISREKNISNDKEVVDFIREVKGIYSAKEFKSFPKATFFIRKIKSQKLANYSVFGDDFGKAPGKNNCQVLLQGTMNLKPVKGGYKLTSNHTHTQGDVLKGEYEAYILARFSKGLSQGGIPDCRISIWPRNTVIKNVIKKHDNKKYFDLDRK